MAAQRFYQRYARAVLGRFGRGGLAAACALAAFAGSAAHAYSPHYRAFADELASYAAWYKPHEAPGQGDAAFVQKDAFTVRLVDFRARFGAPH